MQLSPAEVTGVAVALLAGSEILSLVPGVKANGWVQLILAVLEALAAQDQQQKRQQRRGRR
jgi:hypothetical protein